MLKKALDKIITFGRMIRFSHTLFALPFALSSVVFASIFYEISAKKIFWIIMAMIGARSAAMGFNRLADKDIDALNPRTKNRELPTGKITSGESILFITIASLLLIYSAYKLNTLCFYLSPVALFIIFFYSFTKRFTWLSHIFLGISLGLAPLGAWLAIAEKFEIAPIILALAVAIWIASSDIIYACQDYNFDVKFGLYSIPQTFGIKKALLISKILHLISLTLFLSLKFILNLGPIYSTGLMLVAVLLVYQHKLVKPGDFSKIGFAFNNINSFVSISYFVFSLLDMIL
jgi:4-hydroxybenzoate polyprenyltransferase